MRTAPWEIGLALAVAVGAAGAAWVLPASIALWGAFGCALAWAAAHRPAAALALVLGCRVLLDLGGPELPFDPGPAVRQSAGAVLLACTVACLVSRWPVREVPTAVGVLAGLLLLAVVRAADFRAMPVQAARLSSPILFLLAGWACLGRARDVRVAFAALGLASIVPVAVTTVLFAQGRGLVLAAGIERLRGAYPYTDALAMAMLVAVAASWHLAEDDGHAGRRFVFGGLAAASAGLLYATYSRTFVLAFAAFALARSVAAGRRRLALAMVAAGVVALAVDPDFRDRFTTHVAFLDVRGPMFDWRDLGSGRLDLWAGSLAAWSRSPVADLAFGGGVGAELATTTDLPRTWVVRGPVDPHNDYLRLLYVVGPFGLGAFVLLQVAVHRCGARLARLGCDTGTRSFGATLVGLNAALATCCAMSNVVVANPTPSWAFWTLAGAGLAAARTLPGGHRPPGTPTVQAIERPCER